MNNPASTKYQSSLLIEELIQPAELQQKNWLLTYLDVFVLIIMLFITLIAFSDFKTNSKNKLPKTVQTQEQSTKPSPQIKSSKKVESENKSKLLATIVPTVDKETVTKPQEKTVSNKLMPNLKTETYQDNLDEINNQTVETELSKQIDETILQEQLTQKVKELGLIDAVNLKFTLGYVQLEIQDNILFHSSEAKLVGEGEILLKKLVTLLQQSTGLIYIEGHTDNRPIKTLKYPSNWELGAARATSVLHYLASQNLEVNRLRAVTYADTKPIADNNTKEGREKNRRVNLVIKVSDKID